MLSAAGVPVDATYHCPHHPDFGDPCECRKPALGMHRQAARELGLDLARSSYVGDTPSDVLPAAATGGRGLLLRTGYGRRAEDEGAVPPGAVVLDDLEAAARYIVASCVPTPPR